MEIALILRELWRLRLLVIIAAMVAAVLGGMTAFEPGVPPQSRQYTVGIASARALVDTPSSAVVNLGLRQGASAAVLPSRAVLLANLLASTPFKDETAKRAGVPPDRLIALADTVTDSGPTVENPLATGATVDASDPRANVLTAHTDATLPLITVNVQSPDAAVAAKLANSAIAVLDDQLSSLAESQDIPPQRRLTVKPLGTARTGVEQRGPSPAIAVAAIVFIFLLLSAAIVPVARIVRQLGSTRESYAEPWAGWDDEEPFAIPSVTARPKRLPAPGNEARADVGS